MLRGIYDYYLTMYSFPILPLSNINITQRLYYYFPILPIQNITIARKLKVPASYTLL